MAFSRFSFPLALKGIAMGVAEAIPGVSGGTIAFITGIYERLIHAIKSADRTFFRHLAKLKLKEAFERIDGLFLVNLLIGMAAGLIAAIFLITELLHAHPTIVWGFFFGLIASSVGWIISGLRRLGLVEWFWMPVGLAVALIIVNATPAEGSEALWYVYLSGTFAICALILPGISGSFILLLLGMYAFILETVKESIKSLGQDGLTTLLIFGAGCVTGLAFFTRLLDWAFARYRNSVLMLMSGFMAGSLWKIWPWRNPEKWLDPGGELRTVLPGDAGSEWLTEIKVLTEENVWPAGYQVGNPETTATLLAIFAGLVLIWFFPRMPERDK